MFPNPRELVVELIKKKRAIQHEENRLSLQQIDAEEELAYAAPANESGLQKKRDEIEAQKLEKQAQSKRAHSFGLRFTHTGLPPTCLACFVDHAIESLMTEIEPRAGRRRFTCARCSFTLDAPT